MPEQDPEAGTIAALEREVDEREAHQRSWAAEIDGEEGMSWAPTYRQAQLKKFWAFEEVTNRRKGRLERLLSEPPTSRIIRLKLTTAERCLSAGDAAGALLALDQARSLRADSPEMHSIYARVYRHSGEGRKAREHARLAWVYGRSEATGTEYADSSEDPAAAWEEVAAAGLVPRHRRAAVAGILGAGGRLPVADTLLQGLGQEEVHAEFVVLERGAATQATLEPFRRRLAAIAKKEDEDREAAEVKARAEAAQAKARAENEGREREARRRAQERAEAEARKLAEETEAERERRAEIARTTWRVTAAGAVAGAGVGYITFGSNVAALVGAIVATPLFIMIGVVVGMARRK